MFLLSVGSAALIILAASRLCGRCAAKFGQPQVVGEMLAGLLLGPTLFGWIAPEWQSALFSPQVMASLKGLGQVGIVLYMFFVGMDTDLERHGFSFRKAGVLGAAGVLPVFAAGALTAVWLQHDFLPSAANSVTFSLFMGIALSITAFPVLARLLQDAGIHGTPLGSLVMTAASLIDVVAWSMVALLLSMINADGPLAGLATAGIGAVFAVFVWLVVRPALRRFGNKLDRNGRVSVTDWMIIFLLLFAAASFTDWIGLHALFGSFLLGMVMPRSQVLQHAVQQKLKNFTAAFLVPIYFTHAGIQANLLGILQGAIVWPSLILLAVAFGAKYASCTLAMKSMGFSWREASSVGGLMNARGLMELIIAEIGLIHGLISVPLYSVLVLMAIVTTMLAVPIYQWSAAAPRPGWLGTGKSIKDGT
jgi:Kef-type K+ transport system membrane component KefB